MSALVPVALVGIGAEFLLGTNAGGKFADRNPIATFIAAALGVILVLLTLIPLSTNGPAAAVLVVLLGATGMAVPPVATGLAVRLAPTAPTLAAALAVSAFNAGIALGSWIAGQTLESALGATGPAVVGVIMTAAGLAPVFTLAALKATRPVP